MRDRDVAKTENFIAWMSVTVICVWLGVVGIILWTAVHFIRKFW